MRVDLIFFYAMLMFLFYETSMMVAFLNVTFDIFSNITKIARNVPFIAILITPKRGVISFLANISLPLAKKKLIRTALPS